MTFRTVETFETKSEGVLVLITVIVVLIVFSVLIMIHELGHLFAAKKAGIKREEVLKTVKKV